jgi:hypothetical protein
MQPAEPLIVFDDGLIDVVVEPEQRNRASRRRLFGPCRVVALVADRARLHLHGESAEPLIAEARTRAIGVRDLIIASITQNTFRNLVCLSVCVCVCLLLLRVEFLIYSVCIVSCGVEFRAVRSFGYTVYALQTYLSSSQVTLIVSLRVVWSV